MVELIAADVELAALKWAKGNSAISNAVNGQIHFEVPSVTPPFPLITVERSGGVAASTSDLASGFAFLTEALIEESILTFSCWAKPFDKASSARVASVLMTQAFNLYRAPVSVTAGGALVTLHGANVSGAIWAPDPDAGFARHVVSTVFTTTSTAA
jgi:hypothetical protein